MSDIKRLSMIWEKRLKPAKSQLLTSEKKVFCILTELAKNSQRILEVGVGRGRMVSLLEKEGVKADFYGLDINHYEGVCKDRFMIGDARNLPFEDSTFDLVYSLGVVEHFSGTEKAISEQGRVTRKNGYVIATCPRLSIYTLPRILVWLLKFRKMGTFKEVCGKNLTLFQMRRYFKKAGLTVVKAEASGAYYVKRWPSLESFLYKVLPERIFGSSLYCVGKKA